MEKFLKRKFTFLKKKKYPSVTKTRENSCSSTAKLRAWCHHHARNHAAAEHNIMCYLWRSVYAAAHICTRCAGYQRPTLQTPTSHIQNSEAASRAFKTLPGMYPPKSLTCLAVLRVLKLIDLHVLVLDPSWTREVKSIDWNGFQHFLQPFHTGRT